MGQLSLTLAHIRTRWKIEAITNHFAIMKVFIILCIVIGIMADFSVGSPVEKQLQEKEVGNILHKIADFFGRKKREAAVQGNVAIAELDGSDSVTGVDRFKREALAEEIKKQLQEKEVGKNVLHEIADWLSDMDKKIRMVIVLLSSNITYEFICQKLNNKKLFR